MCGFAGYLHLLAERPADAALIQKMAATLVHRGPDAEGFFIDGPVGLGFRRLAIIDLETGDQPLFNEDRSIVLLCNGEIFNYHELRETLLKKGHSFYTQSDVEVLIHLYEDEGPSFVRRLNGQFAIVLYDRRQRQLFLARDPFGINPLHYTVADGQLIFASEIKAILEHPAVERRVDLTGLDQLMSFPGAVSPRTLFAGISSLEPGHYLLVRGERIENVEYWDLDYPRRGELEERPESDYVEELSELFMRAVRYRLLADVPVGFYLSGGLDSSLVAAAIAQATNGEARHSFSIAFADEKLSEAKYQRQMAEFLGSRHHEEIFDHASIAERLPRMIYHCETPVKESFNTCALALSESVRTTDVKVVLAGQGADELFAGYMGYRFDQAGLRAEKSYDLETALEDEVRERLWGDPDLFYEKDQVAHRELKTALYSSALNELFPDFDATGFSPVNHERLRDRDYIHQRSYLDFKLRLADHLLSEHGDRMVMASSIEGRYPFLDIDLVNFATRIPPRYKLNGFDEKYIVKKIAEPLVPKNIIEREKLGFRAPGTPYLLQHGSELAFDLLSPERIERQGYFNPEVVARLVARYSQPGFELNAHLETDLLMVVLTFGIFLDRFDMPSLS